MFSTELIQQVKRKLNITWSDEDTDANVLDIMESAAVILRRKLGIKDESFDFSAPGAENLLFRAYCLYDYNHRAEEFDENYANDIAQTRDKHLLNSLEVSGDE